MDVVTIIIGDIIRLMFDIVDVNKLTYIGFLPYECKSQRHVSPTYKFMQWINIKQ